MVIFEMKYDFLKYRPRKKPFERKEREVEIVEIRKIKMSLDGLLELIERRKGGISPLF